MSDYVLGKMESVQKSHLVLGVSLAQNTFAAYTNPAYFFSVPLTAYLLRYLVPNFLCKIPFNINKYMKPVNLHFTMGLIHCLLTLFTKRICMDSFAC